MADVIELASTGRASCRGCSRKIVKAEFRFGESLPNPFAAGEAIFWFHLTCAACMRPEKLLVALRQSQHDIPDRARLEDMAKLGQAHRRLPRLARAERSSSGRARCRACHELIDKATWRLSLQAFEEGRMMPLGFIHLACAEAYFGTDDIVERIRMLGPNLSVADLAEVAKLLKQPLASPAGAREASFAQTPSAKPHPKVLAKTRAATGASRTQSSSPRAEPLRISRRRWVGISRRRWVGISRRRWVGISRRRWVEVRG